MFYVIHTSLLDESICDQVYRIRFMEYQLRIIRQLLEMLNAWNRSEEEEDDDYEDEEDIDFH